MWGSSPRRKNTKAARIKKLEAKIAKKKKKLEQDNKLKQLQKSWDSIRTK